MKYTQRIHNIYTLKMPVDDEKIVIYCTKKEKQDFRKFCKIKNRKSTMSAIAWEAIRYYMDEHDPATVRGSIHEIFKQLGITPKVMK